jgi:tetratricopeptide (TPR) repeat protein/TolB-like protein
MEGRCVLDGWKAITAYLGRTERTCRKWEHELGLPVHRLDDSHRAHVFAYADELDRWREEKLRPAKSQIARVLSLSSLKTRIRLVAVSAAVLLVILAAGILGRFVLHKKAPAAPKIENSIAVISFENQTGDPAYDYLQKAIPNLLITNLENTGLFYVSTWERMQAILKQTGGKPAPLIDSRLGFEFCRREGIKALAVGSFTKAGDVFRTDVKVLDAETMGLLKGINKKGMGVDSILDEQVDALCRDIALGLGVEKAKVDAARLNIKDIATPSLSAYDYFLKAREAYALESWENVKKYSEKAVEIDPKYAMAYYFLAFANFFLDDIKARNETIQKAMAFSYRTPEKDRLYLEGAYANFISRDHEKYQQLLNEIIRRYPKEEWAFHNLGDSYFVERNYAGAYDQFKKWLELDPRDTFALSHLLMVTIAQRDFKKAMEYVKMREAIGPPDTSSLHWQAVMYRKMGQLDKAIAKNKGALEIDRNFLPSFANLIALYAIKEEYDECLRWADEFVSRAFSVGSKSGACRLRGIYQYWRGKFKEAFDDLNRAEKMAEEVENWSQKADSIEWQGIVYVALGDLERSRNCFDQAAKIAEEHSPKEVPVRKAHAALWMGNLDIKRGRVDEAEARLSELESFLPQLDQRTQKEINFWHDLLQGEVFLAQGSLDAALSVSQKTCRPGAPFLENSSYCLDLLARVYVQRGEVSRAISEYERLLKPDVTVKVPASEYAPPMRPYGTTDVVYLVHPLYHQRLGLLYERMGETGKARDQYEKFLDLWKNADPGRPEVEEARKRLAGLPGRESSAQD